MKILIISPYIPWPLYSGACVRIFNLLKRMSLDGNKIILLAGKNNLPVDFGPDLRNLCEKIYTYNVPILNRILFIISSIFSSKIYPAVKFQSKEFHKIVSNILLEEEIDAIWVNFSIVADMLPSGLNKKVFVLLDQHESERLMYRSYLLKGNLAEKIFAIINIVKIKKFEERVFSKINALICVSDKEAIAAKKYIRNNVKVLVAPNGVEEKFFNSNAEICVPKANIIVFCANMAVRRNIEAAIWFAKKVFPNVKKQIADAEFMIVGSWPSQEVLKLSSISGVNIVGMVKNIEDYYSKGKVFVAPYFFGAGTKLKIVEAMASGVPVVSTTVGAQGIDVIDNKNIIIANGESDFLNNVVELLLNDKKAEEIAIAGQKLVREKYTWDKIATRLELEINKLVLDKKNAISKK